MVKGYKSEAKVVCQVWHFSGECENTNVLTGSQETAEVHSQGHRCALLTSSLLSCKDLASAELRSSGRSKCATEQTLPY